MIVSRSVLLLLTIYLMTIGCSDKTKRNMMPGISYCDSAAVMYYDTPGNPRFFKMSKVREKSTLTAIGENVNRKVITGKDSCITQGKIYYYGKRDEVFVIYFNKDESCMQLSFIKTGEKYFTKMTKATQQILDDLQKEAKEPGVKN